MVAFFTLKAEWLVNGSRGLREIRLHLENSWYYSDLAFFDTKNYACQVLSTFFVTRLLRLQSEKRNLTSLHSPINEFFISPFPKQKHIYRLPICPIFPKNVLKSYKKVLHTRTSGRTLEKNKLHSAIPSPRTYIFKIVSNFSWEKCTWKQKINKRTTTSYVWPIKLFKSQTIIHAFKLYFKAVTFIILVVFRRAFDSNAIIKMMSFAQIFMQQGVYDTLLMWCMLEKLNLSQRSNLADRYANSWSVSVRPFLVLDRVVLGGKILF